MSQFKPTKYHLISYGFIILALISYIILRAIKVDITNDEAYTFYNVTTFWIVEVFCTGNTHWLIFSFIKLLNLIGFEHVFAIRLFSVLSAIGICLLCLKFYLSKYKLHIALLSLGFILLNPYLIDYYSLARGYASALFFQFLALMCLYQITRAENKKWIYLFFIASVLSVISNFNYFYFFVAAMSLFAIYSVQKHGLNFMKTKEFMWWLVFTISCSLVTIKALHVITVCSNDIGAYGGSDFVTSVFGSQLLGFCFFTELKNSSVFFIASFVLAICIGAMVIYNLSKKTKKHFTYKQLLSLIILIMLILSLFNKFAFNVLYPIDRTATIFYFPFILLIIHTISNLSARFKYIRGMVMFSVILLFTNFILSVNLNHSIDFPEQQDSKKCFEKLDNIKARKVGLSKELFGVYRNYYQKTSHYNYHFEGYALNANEYYDSRFNKICLNEFDYIVLIPPYKITHCLKEKIVLSPVKYFQKSGLIILKIN